MKISIVTVCYNCITEIEATIVSVVSQNYSNIEYLIVDGGSTDGTMDIVNKYANRIFKIISEPDSGVYDAMNKALDFASGDWIIFMNAGDIFVNFHVISDVFEISKITDSTAVIHGDFISKYEAGYVYNKGLVEDKIVFCHQAIFTRLEIHKKHHFDLSYKITADRYVNRDILEAGGKMLYVPVPITIYKAYGGVSSSNVLQIFLALSEFYGREHNLSYYWDYLNCLIILFKAKFVPQCVRNLKNRLFPAPVPHYISINDYK